MRKIILIIISLIFLFTFILLLKTGKEGDIRISLKKDSSIEEIKILQKRNNETTWVLTASKADFIGEIDKAELKDVKIYFEKDGVMFYAKDGVYDFKTKSFTTDSIVNAESKDFKITANAIDYNIDDRRLKTGGKVKVSGRNFEIDGVGLVTDKNQKVILEKDVTAIFNK